MRYILTGDWHIGAASTSLPDLSRIAKNYWKDYPVILMGDIADYGYFKGMQFNQALHPQEQVNEVEAICKGLNIVAYTLGNHEMRVYEQTGLNPYQSFLHMKPTNYFRAGSKLIYFNHGKSAAKNIFLEHQHLMEWVRADVIALGHNHALAKQLVITSDFKTVHFIRTGSFIGYANYAKRAMLSPNIRGWSTYDTEDHTVKLWYINSTGAAKEI